MLMLSRKASQSIVIDGNIRVYVSSIQGTTVRLGIEAPQEVPIYRHEILPEQDGKPSAQRPLITNSDIHKR